MNIIGKRHIYLTVSAILVGAAIVAVGLFGFRQGIDFHGGALWRVAAPADTAITATSLRDAIREAAGTEEVHVIAEATGQNFVIKMGEVPENNHQAIFAALAKKYPGLEELSFQSIGPSVGAELRQNSLIALVLVLIGISLYIAFAFRKVFKPVSSWKYGVITLVTLFHDVAIPAGLLAALGHYQGVEIDGNFIVALLVIMGFSVHDTIVVFDRIRENLFLDRGKQSFAHIVNESVNQTIARSVNTSLTLIFVLVALYFVGPKTLEYFIFTLIVGVTTGIYSSIFVASPLLIVWQNWSAPQGRR